MCWYTDKISKTKRRKEKKPHIFPTTGAVDLNQELHATSLDSLPWSWDGVPKLSSKGMGWEPPLQKEQHHHYELYLFPVTTLQSINSPKLCSKEEL